MMAKKPKDDRDTKIARLAGTVAIEVVRETAPTVISAVDPVILALRQCFGRYKLEIKLTKSPKIL